MRILELFAGTGVISAAFRARGHETVTVDWSETFDVDHHLDVGSLTADTVRSWFGGEPPDVVWASPDCTTYSVAGISHHRLHDRSTGALLPRTEYGEQCDRVNAHVVDLIRELNPRVWFIENPVGAMRKMPWMEGLPRYTVTYCQYGENRQKPTDIWTNHPDPRFRPPCVRGAPCHEPSPRGSRCGTQRLKTARERARIPDELCRHIVEISEEVCE